MVETTEAEVFVVDEKDKQIESLTFELETTRQKLADLEKFELERKHSEERLKIEGKSRDWLECSPVCTKIVDLDFNLQYMSSAGIVGLGIDDVNEYYGKPYPFDFFPEDFKKNMLKNLKKVKATGEVVMGEAAICDLSGNELWFHATLLPVNDDQGELDYIIVVSINTTERKKLETQLRQSQKMEAIGVLTGGIAHEFNNLLGPILGNVELIMDGKEEDDPDLLGLEQIKTVSIRAKELVKQMMAYGRKSLSLRKSLRLETVVADVTSLIKNTINTNIVIKHEIEIDLPPVLGMPNEIHQVVLNLCLNAAHSMPDGGELTMTLKDEGHFKFINLEGKKRSGHYVGLGIRDTGTGMDPETIDRIYDPFFTTRESQKGSGLGLSVVQGIVEQHQGHIEVTSELGRGTTFYVHFPVSKEPVELAVRKSESLNRGTERILLVDDEFIMIDVAKRMLEKLGYTVETYLDCLEALEYFESKPQDFDLVITDYGMTTMNGKEFTEKVKKIRPDIAVILLTGYGDLLTKEDIAKWGLDDLLIKPVHLDEFSASVRGVLDKNYHKAGVVSEA